LGNKNKHKKNTNNTKKVTINTFAVICSADFGVVNVDDGNRFTLKNKRNIITIRRTTNTIKG
jgi:hypothetical protein